MHAAKSNGRDHPYVERRPGVCGGEPVIVGTLAHVHDALSFYHDHRSVIDRAIRENRETTVRRGAGELDAAPKGRGRVSRRR